ncbi:MAG: dienelactone hydrolase [Paraglaciecola sp.]|jgi:dienelactone hydrolase
MAPIRNLFVSDIFGINSGLLQLLEVVSPNALNTQLIDPYVGQQQKFSSEQEAYQRFQAVGGIDAYINIVKDAVSDLNGLLTIVGFSAGGAAIWKAMEGIKKYSGIELVLFYPGQIRHYLEAENAFPTTILWPSHEPHFALNEVIKNLQNKKNVKNIHTPFSHGFMNVKSAGYSEAAYQQYTRYLQGYCKAS